MYYDEQKKCNAWENRYYHNTSKKLNFLAFTSTELLSNAAKRSFGATVLAIDSVGTELALSWYINYIKVNLHFF
jgi:hypothetical protein